MIATVEKMIDSCPTIYEEVHCSGYPFPFFVVFESSESIGSMFYGSAESRLGENVVKVRQDLPLRVQRFVIQHELHHAKENLIDYSADYVYFPYTHFKGGAFGREFRASIVPGLKDPLGLVATILASITSKKRLLLYLDRFKNNY